MPRHTAAPYTQSAGRCCTRTQGCVSLSSAWGEGVSEVDVHALGVCSARRTVFAAVEPDIQQLLPEFVQPLLLHPFVPLLVPALVMQAAIILTHLSAARFVAPDPLHPGSHVQGLKHWSRYKPFARFSAHRILPHSESGSTTCLPVSLSSQYLCFIVFVSVGDQHTLPIAETGPLVPRHAVQVILRQSTLRMPPGAAYVRLPQDLFVSNC